MRGLVNPGGATGDAAPNADHVAQLKNVVRTTGAQRRYPCQPRLTIAYRSR